MVRHAKNEDLDGYIRGAHKDGPEVCPGYVFHKPGSSSTPEKTIWGWNDTDTFYCDRCKLPAVDHIVLKEPEVITQIKRDRAADEAGVPRPAASFNARSAAQATGDMAPDPTAVNPALSEQRRKRQEEEAAFINAGYSADGMLGDDNDPLAIAARPKKPPPPPPPPQPTRAEYYTPPAERAMAQQFTDEQLRKLGNPNYTDISEPAQFTPTGADLASGTAADPALQELLQRDASSNDAFKREVERMIRDANRDTELQARLTSLSAPSSAVGGVVAEKKDLAGCAVSLGTFADAGALLKSVSLEKYESMFNEEAMDPDTLIEVLSQQGKAALEDALKELGIKSMGHRLKIINALIVQ